MVEKKLGNKREIRKCEKKCPYPALIESPGRWTGNKFIFKGGLITTVNRMRAESEMSRLLAPSWVVLPETLYHRDDALLYIAYVMLIWAAPIPADRWHCSLWP